MKKLYLLRHAKSDWGSPELSDHERPLNSRGRKAAPKMGAMMAEKHLLPELVLCSDAVRARETAELAMAAASFDGKVQLEKRLYLAEPQAFFDLLTEVPPGTASVLMVAHNPGISILASSLAGSEQEMPTAALCCFEFEVDEIAEIDAQSQVRFKERYLARDL